MRFRLAAVSLTTVTSGLLCVSLAAAQPATSRPEAVVGAPPPAAAPPTAPPTAVPANVYIIQQPPPPPPIEVPFKRIAITWNPLALVLLRASFNVEILPIPHHAIEISPDIGHLSVGDDSSNSSSYLNFGGELGYRFYSGHKGANGFFAGASFVAQRFQVKNTINGVSSTGGFNMFAGALDIGGQHVFDNGFTIGGGGGIMYMGANSTSSAQTSTFLRFNGIWPRFLFSVGYSF